MTDQGRERRKHKRYHMDAEVYFDFIYELETKVEFKIMDEKGKKALSEKYQAYSRNISVGGICICGPQKVNQGDMMQLEVYLPGSTESVLMQGRAEWCKPVSPSYEDHLKAEVEGQRGYEVGVRLYFVNGKAVEESVHHDPVYDVDWSVVLESVFGNFRMLMEGVYKSQKDSEQK